MKFFSASLFRSFRYLWIVVVSASCLDVEPTALYTETDFWLTDEDYESALTSCYSSLYDPGLFGGDATPLFFETVTPNAYNYNNSYGFSVIAGGTQTSSNSYIINSRWRACYGLIGRSNTLIDRLSGFAMEEQKKKQMMGEALFLRGLGYFLLATHYGDVPLILETPDEAKHASLPRTAKSEVIGQVIADLDSARIRLPGEYPARETGRATRGAARALQARVFLYNDRWAEAEQACDEIRESGRYTLYPDYRSLFLAEHENNAEVIFDIRFDVRGVCHSADLVLQLYNSSAPLLDLVQSYQMADGTDYGPSKSLYVGRDPRFYATLVYPGACFIGKEVQNNTFSMTGYAFKKYTCYDSIARPLVLTDSRSDINYIFLRYADVLLMYAEARNERLRSPDQAVYEALNEVRQRPGVNMPPYDPAAVYPQAVMRELIRNERRIEFAGEGLYYFDILRWRTAGVVMNREIRRYDGVKIMRRYFDEDKSWLWPVPDREIRYNPDLLPNNPGY